MPMTPDVLSPLAKRMLREFCKAAAGRQMFCVLPECGRMLDHKTVRQYEVVAYDAAGARLDGHSVIVCGGHDDYLLDKISDTLPRMAEIAGAARVVLQVTSARHGVDHPLAEVDR